MSGKSTPQWTFLRSAEFVARRDFLFDYFEKNLDRVLALHSPRLSGQLKRSIDQWVAFVNLMEALESGTALPEQHLALVKAQEPGIAIYSLVYYPWRCFYLVRADPGTCTAMQIDKMTTTEQNAEYHRHTSGPMLPSHP